MGQSLDVHGLVVRSEAVSETVLVCAVRMGREHGWARSRHGPRVG